MFTHTTISCSIVTGTASKQIQATVKTDHSQLQVSTSTASPASSGHLQLSRMADTTSSRPLSTSMGAPAVAVSSSPEKLWLLLPHVILALVILLLLFVDFLLYRKRTRFLQKRVLDKQELMETFPRRVIGGVYRNIPSVAASPLHTPNHVPSNPPKILADDIPASTKSASDTPATTTTTTTANMTSPESESGSPPESARRRIQKKKLKLSEDFRSLKNETLSRTTSVARPVSVATNKNADDELGRVPASRRRLEKRETCRKLPPISADSRPANGFVKKEDKVLAPLIIGGEKEESSTA